ncbi:MAG: hypothetical protein LBI17_00165 [Rickettsiales bacterium]|jgi:hypothetical protein|nr:hypothetical protein [Rickettsiales bacterium]
MATAAITELPLTQNFFNPFKAIASGIGKLLGHIADHPEGLLKTVQLVAENLPEIATVGLALSGVIVDPVILYLLYKTGHSAVNMFVGGEEKRLSVFDETLKAYQGFVTKLDDDEAAKEKEKVWAKSLGLRNRKKSKYQEFLKAIGSDKANEI